VYTFTADAVNPLYCDFETQSPIDLKKFGTYQYIRNPFTRIMSGVWVDPKTDTVHIWLPGYTGSTMTLDDLFAEIEGDYKYRDLWQYDYILYRDDTLPDVIRELCITHTNVAHNAEMFDAWLADEKILPDVETVWHDNIHACRYAGIPAGLDGALKHFGDIGKGDSASMKLLTAAKPGPRGTIMYNRGTTSLWVNLIVYNIYDTVKLRFLSERLQQGLFTKENELVALHGSINQNGFYIDRQYTRRLRDIWIELQNNSKDEIERITGGALKWDKDKQKHDITSPAKVKAWLVGMGFHLPDNSLNRAKIEQILNRPDDYISGMSDQSADAIIATLGERRNAVRSVTGKLERILSESDESGLVRNWCVLHGATTGRFSGRGIQPHNFPRGVKLTKGFTMEYLIGRGYDLTYADILQSAYDNSTPEKECIPADVLSTLTRSTIIPDTGNAFAIFDYSQIESRGVAWIFDCKSLTNSFWNNDDIYCKTASTIYGRKITKADEVERFVGKTTVLGCGYQMGHEKFALMCQVLGIDLSKAGVTAKECVKGYRTAYPEIVNGWSILNAAAIRVVKHPGEKIHVGRCTFYSTGDYFRIVLPSGRVLQYRNPEIIYAPLPWNLSERVEQLTYQHPYGYYKKLYGGILAENIVQALSRDILSHALCLMHRRLDYAFFPLHVHDEIVTEYPATKDSDKVLRDVGELMTTLPKWADGFPLAAEGHAGTVYTKENISGKKSVNYLAANRF
jgi:DNA polymerase